MFDGQRGNFVNNSGALYLSPGDYVLNHRREQMCRINQIPHAKIQNEY
mgnify:FL=1